jgi:hypothetical protein
MVISEATINNICNAIIAIGAIYAAIKGKQIHKEMKKAEVVQQEIVVSAEKASQKAEEAVRVSEEQLISHKESINEVKDRVQTLVDVVAAEKLTDNK